MKLFTGLFRPIDRLGRVIIPKAIRRSFQIEHGDELGFSLSEDGQELIIGKGVCGITRPLDREGRVLIPHSMRQLLHLEAEDKIEFHISDETQEIFIRKFKTGCVICGSKSDLEEVRGLLICDKCLIELKAKVF